MKMSDCHEIALSQAAYLIDDGFFPPMSLRERNDGRIVWLGHGANDAAKVG